MRTVAIATCMAPSASKSVPRLARSAIVAVRAGGREGEHPADRDSAHGEEQQREDERGAFLAAAQRDRLADARADPVMADARRS